jgi:spore germination protein YaaH
MQIKYLLALGSVPGMLAAVPSPSPVVQKNAVTTPQPTQPGMVNNCNAFYKVASGDTCESIINKFGTFSYSNL